MGFIDKLHDFNLEIVEGFVRNYEVDKIFVKGKEINFYEEVIVNITGIT